MERILLIDDDIELCEMTVEYLTGEGFDVDMVHNGKSGLDAALSGRYILTILDVMLPGLNGLDVLRRIRETSSLPVLMLTARGGEAMDRVIGLEIGADDYLAKPYNPRELTARIRSILRRSRSAVEKIATISEKVPLPADRECYTVGGVQLDCGARTVKSGGASVILTAVEFELLLSLLRRPGKVVERDTLAQAALGRKLSPYDRSLDMHLSNLRKKLGNNGEHIKTIRSVGFLFALPVAKDE